MEEDIESLDKQSLAFYELPLEPNNDKIIDACLCFWIAKWNRWPRLLLNSNYKIEI